MFFFTLLLNTLPTTAADSEYIPERTTPKTKGYYVHKLKLDQDKKPTSVYLPYPYLRIPSEKKVQIVTQGAVSLLKLDSTEDVMIIGTLKPCIGIAIYNSENRFLLGYHFHWSNKLENITAHLPLLENKDPKMLKTYIYSKELESSESYERQFKIGYGRRSHSAQLAFIKEYLSGMCFIPSNAIEVKLFPRASKWHHGYLQEYLFADACIAFKNEEGLPYNTCLMHEDIFKLNQQRFRPVDMSARAEIKGKIKESLGDMALSHEQFKLINWGLRYNVIFEILTRLEISWLKEGLDIQSDKDLPWELYGKFKSQPDHVPICICK